MYDKKILIQGIEMKLNQIMSSVTQREKSKFIAILDKLCLDAAEGDKSLTRKIESIDGQIKNASGTEITQLYSAVKDFFMSELKKQLSMNSAQISLLINILTRDGNCVARISWIENLYLREWDSVDALAKEIQEEINSTNLSGLSDRGKVLSTYHACMTEAYENDVRCNRDARVTDDERGILNVLSTCIGTAADECIAIEHLVDKIPKTGVVEALNTLRDMGVIFISKQRQEVLIPEEIVFLLNEIQGKDLSDKHRLRLLRTFSDAELSNILKAHGRKIRGVSRAEKIRIIIHSGLNAREILSTGMHAPEDNQSYRKERLKQLIHDLDIETSKIGSTLDDRIMLIISSLAGANEKEFNAISTSGFKDLLITLEGHYPEIISIIKVQFELEDSEIVDSDKLRTVGITPYDILFLLSNEEVKAVRQSMELPKRGNPRLSILECFANATDKLIENYELLARRDINKLREVGAEISESDIGIKFEEVTKVIFEMLGLNVDEEARKAINTNKDKADIIVKLSDSDIIIGEAKTCKSGDFAKYSSTSRQVKAYATRAEAIGKRVAQVLIIAPSFSEDFIESAEMDTQVNISLLEARGLKLILDTFKSRRNPKFSAKLLTKGGVLKAELIAKTI